MSETASPTAAIATAAPAPHRGPWRRVVSSLLAGRIGRWFTITLAVAAFASGLVTFAAITGAGAIGLPPGSILVLVNLNLALLLVLGTVLAARVVRVWIERRRGIAGSRLHVRLVLLFGLVAVLPTIIVTAFSAVFFNRGLESWFNERVRTALEESLAASRIYLREHEQALRGEALAMATELARASPLILAQGPRLLQALLERQAALRGLTEAVVFDGTTGQVFASGGLLSPQPGEVLPSWAIAFARTGEVALLPTEEWGRVRALVDVDLPGDAFLLIGRPVDANVLAHVARTEQAVAQYREAEASRSRLQITFALVYAVVALVILFGAVLIGLLIAGRIARPLAGLVSAAESVRSGDLSVRVSERSADDEIGVLSRAFNRMLGQLEANRAELMAAYRQIDERRRFTEGVLEGVSAGVIGLDAAGRIDLPNRSASELLGIDLLLRHGAPLAEVVPDFAPLLEAAAADLSRPVQGEVRIATPSGRRQLLVRIAPETAGGELRGFVVTFDDVTALVAAQRQAAWADVARRIAHEIKNPLTPIQLSAERLKRKYRGQITADLETFETCTDTIIRQVGDIGRMVDEFSAFARMPQPILRPEPVDDVVQQALFLHRQAHPEIAYSVSVAPGLAPVAMDRRLIGQALTNLLANAADAIAARPGAGRVTIEVAPQGNELHIAVEDDGEGLPKEGRESLTEPYVTRKPKGTGLGLAIVKKIMEDHGGRLLLDDRADGGTGARVTLVLPMSPGDQMAATRSELAPPVHGA
ncbi:MAG: PAS domain-containing sensor histidine kinase [Elioraea sp.]|nr:PAS domain-containing sensor histidine kinase [Elioraea sp.]